ncbi:MAG TPA: type II secretion system protein [Candidatus Paceibacterota bacterium]|nr:type II secretion system protein [Candidatus Paceibacterota bacterium]
MKRQQRGFTLIEMLVYIAVFVLISSALVVTFLSFNTTFVRNQTERALTQEARVALDTVIAAVKHADTVDGAQSLLNVSPGILELESGATTTRFYISSGALVYAINGTEIGPLTSNAIVVESVVFQRYVGTTTDMIRMALTLHAESKVASSTRTFYTSAIMRGTYE